MNISDLVQIAVQNRQQKKKSIKREKQRNLQRLIKKHMEQAQTKIEQMKVMYENGVPVDDIAKKLNVSKSIIYYYASQNGWQRKNIVVKISDRSKSVDSYKKRNYVVTIPTRFCDLLGLKPGDYVVWKLEGNRLVLEKIGEVGKDG